MEQIRIFTASTTRELEEQINRFLSNLSDDQLVDVKIGRGDFESVMVLYKV